MDHADAYTHPLPARRIDMRVNDQSFDNDPPEGWGGDQRGPYCRRMSISTMSSLLDGFPAYREEVFIRLVTDSSRADAVKMSDAGFGRLSTADFGGSDP